MRNVDRTQAKQVVELQSVDQAFAGSNGNRGFIHDLLHALRIPRPDRFFDEQRPRRRQRMDVLQRRAGRCGTAVKVDHDLDFIAYRFAQLLHHATHVVLLFRRGSEMRVGNEHDFERAITFFDHLQSALDHLAVFHAFVDRGHVAEAQVGIDLDLVVRLAAQQAPHRDIEFLAPDVPQGHLDAADGSVADHPQAPERMLDHHPHRLLDIARIAADHQRLQVLHGADDAARLPFQRCFAPAEKSGLVRLHAHEYPVAHLGIAHRCLDRGYFHRSPSKDAD